MVNKPTVFVSIASYRDSELIPTLCDMIKKARHPHLLSIVVCWQHDETISLYLNAGMRLEGQQKLNGYDLFTFSFQNAKVEAISVHYFQSKGACWARSLCESRYAGEDYFLQIDSHCRFTESWDSEMVSLYAHLTSLSQRPVLTGYPPAYKPQKEEEKADYVSRLIFREFSSEGLVTLTSTPFSSTAPERGSYIAGGFIFSAGTFMLDVPNDPNIFFEGEEIAMAARAFTHGYDVYYPHKPLLWHFYGRQEHRKVWSDHDSEAKEAGAVERVWWERDRVSKKRVRMLLGIEPDDGTITAPYRLGTMRTLREFEYTLGIDFKSATLLPEVIEAPRCAWFDYKDCSEDAWRRRLIKQYKKAVKLEKAQIEQQTADVSYWHIGVYNSTNDLIASKELTAEETAAAIAASSEETIPVEMQFTVSGFNKPSTIRICPYITDQGWGEVKENAWEQ